MDPDDLPDSLRAIIWVLALAFAAGLVIILTG